MSRDVWVLSNTTFYLHARWFIVWPEDKATTITDLRNFQSKEEDEDIENGFSSTRKIVVIDDMATINKINIATSWISNWEELAKCFIDMIHEMKEYNKFRVLFDRYDTKSLKNYAGLDQTKRFPAVHYHIFDTTKILHLQTEQFLTSIKTRKELVENLLSSQQNNMPLSKEI